MELADANDFFKKAGVEVVGVSCGEPEGDGAGEEDRGRAQRQQGTETSAREDAPGDMHLDEFETGMYLCRWPNGEFSLVMAPTRRDALVELDEWAPGHSGQLFPMGSCMLDFRLSDDGQVEFNQFGEDTEAFIWETAYPELDQLRYSEAVMRPDGEYTPEGKELFGRLWSTNVHACGTTSRRTQRPKRKRERNCKNSLGWQAPSLTTSFKKRLEEFLNRSLRKGERSIRR